MKSLLAFVALLGVAAAYEDKTVVEYLRDNNYTVLSKLLNDSSLASVLSSSGKCHGFFNPYLPSGLCYPYQLDESISNFRGLWCNVSFLFHF